MVYAVTAVDPQTSGDDIRALWRRNLPEASAARFDWLYSRQSQAWLLKSDEQQPIGSSGLLMRTLHVCGRTLRCGCAIDLNVDREHRTVGPALALQRALVRDAERLDVPLIYALPSPSAAPVIKRLGYVAVGEVRRWAKPLIAERKLRGRLKSRLLSQPAGFLADGWLRWTSAEREHRLPRGWSFQERTIFDSDFDDLWSRSGDAFAVIGERTAQYLSWRYGDYPDFTARLFCLHDAKHRLQGYAVMCVEGEFADISDLWFADLDMLRLVVGSVLKTGRRLGWASLSFPVFAPAAVRRVLSDFGLKPRDARQVFAWVSPKFDETTRRHVLDESAWYLTKADSDTDV